MSTELVALSNALAQATERAAAHTLGCRERTLWLIVAARPEPAPLPRAAEVRQ